MLIALVLLCLLGAAQTSPAFWPRLPSSSPTHESEFGIGIDLTASYGAIAIAYGNGSHIPLARVNASAAYRDVVFRLSLSREEHRRRPDLEISEKETIDVFAEMVASLAHKTKERYNISVKAAAITVPHLPILEDLPLQAALFLSGIDYVQVLHTRYFGRTVAFHEHAVLAGHGLQVCQPYTSPPGSCADDLRMENYYAVGYYADALEIVLAGSRLAYEIRPLPYTNTRLGFRAKKEDEAAYWEEVRKWLTLPLLDFVNFHPTRLLFFGDGSVDAEFRDFVGKTLASLGRDVQTVVHDDVDENFAAAFGAADLLLRKPYWDGARKAAWLELKQDL